MNIYLSILLSVFIAYSCNNASNKTSTYLYQKDCIEEIPQVVDSNMIVDSSYFESKIKGKRPLTEQELSLLKI